MQESARYQAIFEIIEQVFSDKQPADNILNSYFRERRYIGSKDRRFISENVWDIIRHRRRLEFEAQSTSIRKLMIVWAKNKSLETVFGGGQYGMPILSKEETDWLDNLPENPYPQDVEAECPQWLFDKIKDFELLKSLNRPATADFRVNAGSRETIIKKMKEEGFDVVSTPFSPVGVRAEERINLNNCITFQDGLIEPQDEASQIAAILADVKPEHKVIDYCCGAGGKSLTLSYLMQNKGQIEAHDIDERRLEAILPRMKRLQANNIKTVKTAEVGHDYDRFIIDAPCSGSGTWRRSPDAKFRLNEKKLLEIIDIQSSLLDLAAKKVKQGGRIVYITCSILEEENTQQITKFLNRNNDFSLVDMQTIWDKKIESPYPFADKNCLKFNPLTTGTDGFFIAVMERVK